MYHLQQGVSVFHGDAIAKEEEKKRKGASYLGDSGQK